MKIWKQDFESWREQVAKNKDFNNLIFDDDFPHMWQMNPYPGRPNHWARTYNLVNPFDFEVTDHPVKVPIPYCGGKDMLQDYSIMIIATDSGTISMYNAGDAINNKGIEVIVRTPGRYTQGEIIGQIMLMKFECFDNDVRNNVEYMLDEMRPYRGYAKPLFDLNEKQSIRIGKPGGTIGIEGIKP